MKTRWYFIIAGAAVVGFAAWYQDFYRRDSLHREQVAVQEARERERVADERRQAGHVARERAAEAAAERRAAREAEAQRQAWEHEQRTAWQSRLAAAREETAALRVNRERVAREIEAIGQRVATQERERAEIANEEAFLESYIAHAHASITRVSAVVEKVDKFRTAAAAAAAAESMRRTR